MLNLAATEAAWLMTQLWWWSGQWFHRLSTKHGFDRKSKGGFSTN
ncbi:hypothetical protein SOVF_113690 [Spinacia oleracea]|nr:hypothetical protein SOVF_113690 [Spinacia oleracea]